MGLFDFFFDPDQQDPLLQQPSPALDVPQSQDPIQPEAFEFAGINRDVMQQLQAAEVKAQATLNNVLNFGQPQGGPELLQASVPTPQGGGVKVANTLGNFAKFAGAGTIGGVVSKNIPNEVPDSVNVAGQAGLGILDALVPNVDPAQAIPGIDLRNFQGQGQVPPEIAADPLNNPALDEQTARQQKIEQIVGPISELTGVDPDDPELIKKGLNTLRQENPLAFRQLEQTAETRLGIKGDQAMRAVNTGLVDDLQNHIALHAGRSNEMSRRSLRDMSEERRQLRQALNFGPQAGTATQNTAIGVGSLLPLIVGGGVGAATGNLGAGLGIAGDMIGQQQAAAQRQQQITATHNAKLRTARIKRYNSLHKDITDEIHKNTRIQLTSAKDYMELELKRQDLINKTLDQQIKEATKREKQGLTPEGEVDIDVSIGDRRYRLKNVGLLDLDDAVILQSADAPKLQNEQIKRLAEQRRGAQSMGRIRNIMAQILSQHDPNVVPESGAQLVTYTDPATGKKVTGNFGAIVKSLSAQGALAVKQVGALGAFDVGVQNLTNEILGATDGPRVFLNKFMQTNGQFQLTQFDTYNHSVQNTFQEELDALGLITEDDFNAILTEPLEGINFDPDTASHMAAQQGAADPNKFVYVIQQEDGQALPVTRKQLRRIMGGVREEPLNLVDQAARFRR